MIWFSLYVIQNVYSEKINITEDQYGRTDFGLVWSFLFEYFGLVFVGFLLLGFCLFVFKSRCSMKTQNQNLKFKFLIKKIGVARFSIMLHYGMYSGSPVILQNKYLLLRWQWQNYYSQVNANWEIIFSFLTDF